MPSANLFSKSALPIALAAPHISRSRHELECNQELLLRQIETMEKGTFENLRHLEKIGKRGPVTPSVNDVH
uniref:Uncharacterized protein n=1 Tax=Romanomermis culicivorax TaxID=13658 RepID=A0A915LDP9_ROMCU